MIYYKQIQQDFLQYIVSYGCFDENSINDRGSVDTEEYTVISDGRIAIHYESEPNYLPKTMVDWIKGVGSWYPFLISISAEQYERVIRKLQEYDEKKDSAILQEIMTTAIKEIK